jgi:hypothetical protein
VPRPSGLHLSKIQFDLLPLFSIHSHFENEKLICFLHRSAQADIGNTGRDGFFLIRGFTIAFGATVFGLSLAAFDRRLAFLILVFIWADPGDVALFAAGEAAPFFTLLLYRVCGRGASAAFVLRHGRDVHPTWVESTSV